MASFTANVAENVIVREAVRGSRGAINVNGTSDTMRFTHPASPNAITASMWFRIDADLNYYSGLWSIEASSSTYLQFGLGLNGTTLICNDLSNERTIQACTVGTWYFVSFSIDTSGNVKMFVGTEGGTLTKYTTTLTKYTAPINEARIGGTSYGEYIDGRIANYKQWDAVLSDAEVHAEFYSDAPVRTSNLVGWYPLENTTNKLEDFNGSNDLTNPGAGSFSFGAGPDIPLPKAEYLNEEVYQLPNEAVGEVYTPGSGGAYDGNVNENVGSVGESIGAVEGAVVGVNETDGLSESTAAAYAANVGPSENVTLSEAIGTQSNEASGLPETVSLSEGATASQGMLAGPGETVSLSEALGAVEGFVAGLAETVTPGESAAAQYGAVVAPAESVSVSEGISIGGSTNYPEGLPETVSLSEALSVVYAPVVASAETVMVAIPAMAELPSTDLHLVAEDWTPGSDWVSRVGGFTAQLHGALTRVGAPDIERNEIRGFTISDYFSLAADAAHELTPSLDVTYEFLIRPTSLGGVLMGRYCAPYAGGFDVAQYSAGALMGIFNTAGDDYYRLVVGSVNLDTGYHLLTLVVHSTEDELYLYVDGVLDASVTGTTSDQINSTPADFHIGKSNGNTLGGAFDGGLIEVMRHRTALKPGQVADRVALVGINRVQAGQGFGVGPSETVTLSEARTSAYSATPSVADTVTITDATALAQTLAQGLPETVTLSEGAAAIAALARAVNETVSLAEALASSISNTFGLAETVNLSDAVALSQVLANALAETVTLAEAMIGYIPRVLVTELGDPTAVKTIAVSAASVVAVETGEPTAVKAATNTFQGLL